MKTLLFLSLLISARLTAQTIIPSHFSKSVFNAGDIPYEMYKGTIPVKTNRNDTVSEYIYLPVQIIKSSSENPAEPVYNFEGGPGQSNFSGNAPTALLADHDLVTVGYRGIDAPEIKNPKYLVKALRGKHHQMFSDESIENSGKALNKFYTDLKDKGIDINNYTITDVIDDFEDVKKQLGHDKINLYSGSYGTRVALLYSYKYPESVKRSFMYGINPPGRCVWYPDDLKRIIRRYDSLYTVQYGDQEKTIEECISTSFEKMPRRWTVFKLDADKIRLASFFLMFQKNDAISVFAAYRKAAVKGDYSGLYLLQLAADYVPPLNMFDLINKAASADYDSTINYKELGRAVNYDLGSPGTALYWSLCKYWPVELIQDEYRFTQENHTETLLVSGSLDVTDPPWIPENELMKYLPAGRRVILKEMAHCGDMGGLQHDAFVNMVQKFFNEGITDTSGFRYDPVSFEPGKNFNKMAKVFYPLVLILSILR